MKLTASDVVGRDVLVKNSGSNRYDIYRIHAVSPNGVALLISASHYASSPKWWVGSKRFLRAIADVLPETKAEEAKP